MEKRQTRHLMFSDALNISPRFDRLLSNQGREIKKTILKQKLNFSNLDAELKLKTFRELQRPLTSVRGLHKKIEFSGLDTPTSRTKPTESTFDETNSQSQRLLEREISKEDPIETQSQPDLEVFFESNPIPVHTAVNVVRRKSASGWHFGNLSNFEMKTQNIILFRDDDSERPSVKSGLTGARTTQRKGSFLKSENRKSSHSTSARKTIIGKSHFKTPQAEDSHHHNHNHNHNSHRKFLLSN